MAKSDSSSEYFNFSARQVGGVLRNALAIAGQWCWTGMTGNCRFMTPKTCGQLSSLPPLPQKKKQKSEKPKRDDFRSLFSGKVWREIFERFCIINFEKWIKMARQKSIFQRFPLPLLFCFPNICVFAYAALFLLSANSNNRRLWESIFLGSRPVSHGNV